jgi:hypothetical protein
MLWNADWMKSNQNARPIYSQPVSGPPAALLVVIIASIAITALVFWSRADGYMSQSIDPWVAAWSTENADSPFEEGHPSSNCPKCGAETKLMRLEKSPDFMGEIRIYECNNCNRKYLVIEPDCQGYSARI